MYNAAKNHYFRSERALAPLITQPRYAWRINEETLTAIFDFFSSRDVVQAVATKKIDFHSVGIDSAAISGHKIGGPKGIGVMFLKTGYKIPSLQYFSKSLPMTLNHDFQSSYPPVHFCRFHD